MSQSGNHAPPEGPDRPILASPARRPPEPWIDPDPAEHPLARKIPDPDFDRAGCCDTLTARDSPSSVRKSEEAEMKAFGSSVAMAVAAAVTSFAGAGIVVEEKIILAPPPLGGGDSWTESYSQPENDLLIIGWAATVYFTDDPPTTAWASDLRIDFNGIGYFVGGFPAPGGKGNWEFQGIVTDLTGIYLDTTHTDMWANDPIPKGLLTGFTLTNDWDNSPGEPQWTVELTLFKVPAPGAIALLGTAALSGRRRRA